MKRLLFSAFAVIISISATWSQPKAGTFSIIPRLGVTLAKITGDKVFMGTDNANMGDASNPKFKPGMMAGVDFEYQFTNTLAASIGAYYSRQGEKYDDITEAHDFSVKKWTEIKDWKTNSEYINVPIMASAYLATNFAVKCGIQFGFNTGAKMEYSTAYFSRNDNGEAKYDGLVKTKYDIDMKKVDVSIPVGISYEYMNVIIDARYNIGLTKVYENIGNNRNSVFTFNVGYRFAL